MLIEKEVVMNTFNKITNAAHKFCSGLEGATIETAAGEFLSEFGYRGVGDYITECGNRSILSATEPARQVPLIGDGLSKGTFSTLSGIRSISRVINKGTSRVCDMYNKLINN